MTLSQLVAIARGDEPADLVLTNARLIEVLSGEMELTEIAIAGPLVVGVGGTYRGGRRSISSVHLESALVRPREYARAVVSRGVTTVITNPHEIANVLGIEGIRFMLEDAERAAMDVFVMVPSCVPATPMATSGADLVVFRDLAVPVPERVYQGGVLVVRDGAMVPSAGGGGSDGTSPGSPEHHFPGFRYSGRLGRRIRPGFPGPVSGPAIYPYPSRFPGIESAVKRRGF